MQFRHTEGTTLHMRAPLFKGTSKAELSSLFSFPLLFLFFFFINQQQPCLCMHANTQRSFTALLRLLPALHPTNLLSITATLAVVLYCTTLASCHPCAALLSCHHTHKQCYASPSSRSCSNQKPSSRSCLITCLKTACSSTTSASHSQLQYSTATFCRRPQPPE